MTGTDPAAGPVGRGKRARAEVADAMIVEDWSWSVVPPPVLGVEGVERGEPHVVLVMVDPDEREVGDGRRSRRLTAAQTRDLAAALDARADVIDPQGARREAGGQAAELWGRQNPAGQDRPDMTVPAVLTRLREWTDAIDQAGLMERVEGPTISSDVATLLAVHPRAAATGDDHGPGDPYGLDGRVTFASIDTARAYAQRHGIEPAGTVRVPWADLVAMLDEFLTHAVAPDPASEIHALAPMRPDHPHRDTILTMLEVVGWMGRGDSRRTRLAVAAQRLDASPCHGAHGDRFRVGDVVRFALDGEHYVIVPTPPAEQPAGRLGQVWTRPVGDAGAAPARIDITDLTLVALAGLGDDPPQPVERSAAERTLLELGRRLGEPPDGDLSGAVASLICAMDELDARHEADDDADSMTVDDVGDVCEAAGLVRDGDEWRDEHVAVRAVTTSCAPLAPGDDRPMYGIHISDTYPHGAFRADELDEQVSPGVLAAVIGDVRRTERLRRAAEEDE